MNFLQAIRIHFRLGLLVVFIVPALSWFYSLTITPIYESSARVLIEAKDLGLGAQYYQGYQTVGYFADPIKTQIEILKSATILDKVIRKFNMRHKSGPRKGQYLSYLNLSGNLEISADRNVDIVELKYKDPNPKVAKDILQAITDSYIEKTIELKASDTASAIRFLKKERNKAEREALDASKRLREFESKSKSTGPEDNQEIVRSAFKLKDLRLSIDSEYAKLKTSRKQLSRQLMLNIDDAILNNTISTDPFLSALREELYKKETQLVQLQAKVKPGHYQLEELKEQIEGSKNLIQERIKELVGKEIKTSSFVYSQDQLRANLISKLLDTKVSELSVKQQLAVIDNAINDLEKKISKLPSEKYIYSQLLRQNEMAKKRLEEIDVRLIESRLKGVIESHVTNIRLIDPPSFASKPKFPNIPATLMTSFLFALCLAALVIYIVEYLDDVIKSADTLPKDMGCPLLVQLPHTYIGDLPVVYQKPRAAFTECIHTLRTNLSFLSLSGNKKLILVTSPGTSEGKSTVSVNLAITYAQSGKRVLLIDSDIRNPSLYKYLSRPKDAVGISNTLINEIDFYDVVQKSILGIVGFDYMPGGDIPPNPVQLLESEKMKELLETSMHIYDLVILDTPPVGIFSDALLLARYADIVTIVSRSNKTSRKTLLASIDFLRKAKAPAMGVILNAVPTGKQDAYGYGYGYGYYGYGDDETGRYGDEQSIA